MQHFMVLVSFFSEGRGPNFFCTAYILAYPKLVFIRWTFKQLKDLFLITLALIFVVKITHVNVGGGFTPYWWGTQPKKSRMVLKGASFQYSSIEMKLNFNSNGGLVLILNLSFWYTNINIFFQGFSILQRNYFNFDRMECSLNKSNFTHQLVKVFSIYFTNNILTVNWKCSRPNYEWFSQISLWTTN